MNNWFVFPEYIIWMLIAPVCLVLLWFGWRRSGNLIRYWFGEVTNEKRLGFMRLIFRSTGLLLLFLALLGPYWGRRMEVINRMGREIFFLVDVSASMNTNDIKPSRLEKVKMEIRRILPQLKGDKVGIIIFTDNAYVQCPLTEDNTALSLFLDLISTDQFTDQGTNYREVLLSALARFSEESDQSSHTRCAVLISDGENYGENFASVVNRMEAKEIRLFTVGVGTKEGGNVPNIQNGIKSGYKTDPNTGENIVSKLNEEALKSLADDFGTIYQGMTQPMDNLNPLMDQLRLQNSSAINHRSQLTSINRYQWPLGISVLLFGISFFMLPLKGRKKKFPQK